MKKPKNNKQLVIYQTKSGAIELRGDFVKETLWATQAQIASTFEVDIRTINEHIQNIYKSGELREIPTIRKFRIVQKEGKREVEREVRHYNLDLILSVGYRVNSKTATLFRQWATKTLKDHLLKGYTINRRRVAKNYQAFLKAVAEVQALIPKQSALDPQTVLDLVKEFASTWVSLAAYDKEDLKPIGATKRAVKLAGEELAAVIGQMRTELLKQGTVTELFAQERRAGSVVGIAGNVMQSFGGQAVYPSVEEKAAHLLYFMIKNHPFTDGNKRAGAFSFVWFLRKYRVRGQRQINPATLTALTLLIAASDPKKKNQMTALTTQLLR